MAELITRGLNLPVLRLSILVSDPSHVPVQFQFKRAGREVAWAEADAADIGLALTSQEMRKSSSGDPIFRLPDSVAAAAHGFAMREILAGECLWIDFATSGTNLPTVPWEWLLHESVGAPILRLPYFATQPVLTRGPFDVLLCASSPKAKEDLDIENLLDKYVGLIQLSMSRDTVVHVFTDAEAYESVSNRLRRRPFVRVYDPKNAMSYAPAPRSKDPEDYPNRIENPWLRWMIDIINRTGRSIDVAHFICHGRLSVTQCSLAFAEAPYANEDRRWARFVGPQQLSLFLSTVGAWSVGISSPIDNLSVLGSRMMADSLARVRPGPVFLVDEAIDAAGLSFADIYKLLSHSDHVPPSSMPGSGAIMFYCHPGYLGHTSPSSVRAASALEGLTIAGDRMSAFLDHEKSSWVFASQRVLEESVAQYVEPILDQEERSPEKRAAEEVLKFATEVIESHARDASLQVDTASQSGTEMQEEPAESEPTVGANRPAEES